MDQNDMPKALDFYQKALKISEELVEKTQISVILNNIADIYFNQSNFSQSLEYYNKALKISEEINDAYGVSIRLLNIGGVYSKLNKFQQALDYYQKSLIIKEKMGDKKGICDLWFHIGNLNLKQKKYADAKGYIIKSLTIADELKLLNLQKNLHQLLSEIYVGTNDYKNAFEQHKQFKLLNDSIFNKQDIKKITGLEYTYKYEKEKQAKELEYQKQAAVEAAEKKQRNIVMYSFIVGFVLMFVLVLVILRSYLHKRRTNRLLTEQKEEILSQAEELKTTNEKLVELDHFKEGMTGMIVHDLKNPLNAILGIANTDETKQAAKQMLNMVLNILDVQKLEDAKMKIEFVDFSINSCLFDALNQVKLLYERKSITVENSIPNNLTVKGDAEIVQRVFINLLTNAIKYTPNNGIICFTNPQGFQNLEGFVRVQISDNGQGITSDKLNSVFDKFVQIDAKKSGGIRSTGLGLTFCKLAVEAHGGQIGVESKLVTGK